MKKEPATLSFALILTVNLINKCIENQDFDAGFFN